MSLPFTTEEFFAVFRDYNEALWPSQVFLNGLAVIAAGFVIWPRKDSGPIISAILALLWAWLALAYHLAFFARINPLAYAFAIVSLAGAIAFVWQGVILRRLQFLRADGARGYTGDVLIVFSLIVYPVWSLLEGHPYPFMPTFGLPCPTTIFTIGMLAFLAPPYPRAVFVVPVLWCLVGATAAFLLGISQDLALLVAGAAGVILSFRATRSSTVK
jgi:hypothetical protein